MNNMVFNFGYSWENSKAPLLAYAWKSTERAHVQFILQLYNWRSVPVSIHGLNWCWPTSVPSKPSPFHPRTAFDLVNRKKIGLRISYDTYINITAIYIQMQKHTFEDNRNNFVRCETKSFNTNFVYSLECINRNSYNFKCRSKEAVCSLSSSFNDK